MGIFVLGNPFLLCVPVLRDLAARSWPSCLTCCLQLHRRVCGAVKLTKAFAVPAASAALIAKVAGLQPAAVSTGEQRIGKCCKNGATGWFEIISVLNLENLVL